MAKGCSSFQIVSHIIADNVSCAENKKERKTFKKLKTQIVCLIFHYIPQEERIYIAGLERYKKVTCTFFLR
jgi:hypothetical protein